MSELSFPAPANYPIKYGLGMRLSAHHAAAYPCITYSSLKGGDPIAHIDKDVCIRAVLDHFGVSFLACVEARTAEEHKSINQDMNMRNLCKVCLGK